MKRSVVISLFVLLIVSAAAFWGNAWAKERARHLGFVPAALEVDRVLFSSEKAWGWGPGAYEVGIIVYELPSEARERIEAQGLDWLTGLDGEPNDQRDTRYSRYENWRTTPYLSDPSLPYAFGRATFDVWDDDSGECLCVPLNREFEALVSRALSTPGSYYGVGRVGLILVIPSESRVVFAYRG